MSDSDKVKLNDEMKHSLNDKLGNALQILILTEHDLDPALIDAVIILNEQIRDSIEVPFGSDSASAALDDYCHEAGWPFVE